MAYGLDGNISPFGPVKSIPQSFLKYYCNSYLTTNLCTLTCTFFPLTHSPPPPPLSSLSPCHGWLEGFLKKNFPLGGGHQLWEGEWLAEGVLVDPVDSGFLLPPFPGR